MSTLSANDEPCPECGGTLDIWADGHAPACRHPRRLLMHPPPPMTIWTTVVRGDGSACWMAGTPRDVGAAIAAIDLAGDLLGVTIAPVAGPN